MRPSLVALLGAAAVLVAPAAAPAKVISGKFAKDGYTVIALAYNGKSAAGTVKHGRFRVAPPASRVTVSLRDAKGRYAGIVVVGKKGKRAIVGIRPIDSLGTIRLSHGVARPVKALPRRSIDRSRTAVTRNGRPIGAGRFGLVRARATGKAGPGNDQDLDGIPGAFDIDDDGDLVLDNNDASSGTRSRQTGPAPDGEKPEEPAGLRLFSNFHFQVDETLNANAGGVTRAAIDDAMTRASSFVGLVFFLPDGVDEAELDCGGLSYCSAGGTGVDGNTFPTGDPFPACCDSDADGLGTIKRGPTGDYQLRTHAPSDKIGSGDTFVELLPDGSQLTGSLNYMFNTTPAIKSYVDGSGAGATVSYPAASDAPGTIANPLVLHADANGEYTLTFTLWRPQRDAIPEAGEEPGFVDLGGLNYQLLVPNAPSSPAAPGGSPSTPGRGPQGCNLTAFTTSEAGLEPRQPIAYHDTALDAAANPDSTLTFAINFTKCLAQAGQTLGPGQQLGWEIQADSPVGDVSAQGWQVCVPAAGRTDCKNQQGPPAGGNPPPAR